MAYQQAATISGSALSIFFWGAWLVRKCVQWFGDAQAAGDMLALIKNTQLNWDAIYLFLAVLGTCIVFSAQYPNIRRTYNNIRKSRKRNWDIRADEAVNYIAFHSLFSKSINTSDKIAIAYEAFCDAARKRKIKTAGRAPNAAILEDIPGHVWATHVADYSTSTSSPGGIDRKATNIRIRSDKNDDKFRFVSIMADKQEIMKNWPPK